MALTTVKKEIALNVGQPNNFELFCAMQGDNKSFEVVATLYDVNKLYTINTDNIKIKGENPVGLTIQKNVDSHTANTVTFTLTEDMLMYDGLLKLVLVFAESSAQLTTFPFIVKVINSPGNNTADDIKTVSALVEEAKKWAMMSKSYAVGTENEVRDGDKTENSKYYYEQIKALVNSGSIGGNDNGSCEDCLPKTNTTPFIPTDDYNPATKKYVDDLVGDISKILDAINRKPDDNTGNSGDTPEDPKEIGSDAEKWKYLLDDKNKTITLWSYIGSDDTVIVYSKYKIKDVIYSTKIASADDTRFGTEHNYMFWNNSTAKNITFNKGINTTETKSMSNMLRLTNLQRLDIKYLDTSSTENFSCMFANMTIEGDTLDLSTLKTSSGTSMREMFNFCTCKSILLSNFDTSKVTDFCNMFSNCISLQQLDLTSFNTLSIEDPKMNAGWMFSNCKSLKEIKVSSATWNILPKNVPTLFTECNISSFTYV